MNSEDSPLNLEMQRKELLREDILEKLGGLEKIYLQKKREDKLIVTTIAGLPIVDGHIDTEKEESNFNPFLLMQRVIEHQHDDPAVATLFHNAFIVYENARQVITEGGKRVTDAHKLVYYSDGLPTIDDDPRIDIIRHGFVVFKEKDVIAYTRDSIRPLLDPTPGEGLIKYGDERRIQSISGKEITIDQLQLLNEILPGELFPSSTPPASPRS